MLGCGLAVLVFPVALLAFADPIDGGGDALVAGLGALGVGNPLDVFALATGAEGGEGCRRLLAGLEGFGEFGGRFRGGRGGFDHFVPSSDGAGVLVGIDEGDGLAQEAEHLLATGQVLKAGEAAKRTHGVGLKNLCLAQDGGDFFSPEAEGTVLLKGGHVTEDDALVFEEGAAPLDGLDYAGAGFVDQLTDVIEDGLREWSGPGDVGVDAGIEGVGWAHVSLLKGMGNSVVAFLEIDEGTLGRIFRRIGGQVESRRLGLPQSGTKHVHAGGVCYP